MERPLGLPEPPDVPEQPEQAEFLFIRIKVAPVVKECNPAPPLLHLPAVADAGPEHGILSQVELALHLVADDLFGQGTEPEGVLHLADQFGAGECSFEFPHQRPDILSLKIHEHPFCHEQERALVPAHLRHPAIFQHR